MDKKNELKIKKERTVRKRQPKGNDSVDLESPKSSKITSQDDQSNVKGKYTLRTARKRKQNEETVPESSKKRKLSERKKKEEVSSEGTDGCNDQKENLKPIQETLNVDLTECKEWDEVDYVVEVHGVQRNVAAKVVDLFNQENTIPFIARYRRHVTNGMESDQLRALKTSLDQAKAIQQRAAVITKAIDKQGKWTPEIHALIKSTKCLNDLEHIYSQFKTASKHSLAERAKELGLGSVSTLILSGQKIPPLSSIVDASKKGLETEQQVRDGIVHIIADTLTKNKVVFEKVKELQKTNVIKIQTTQSKQVDAAKKGKKTRENDFKYERYYNFDSSVSGVKPHHILAINRAESQKIINVKINIPDSLFSELRKCCLNQNKTAISASRLHRDIIEESIDYAYKKSIKPLIARRVRNEMKEMAVNASINVFASNIKQLLLTSPVRGKVVAGVDPGFKHGCKIAIVSEQGNVLDVAVIYPHSDSNLAQKVLTNLVIKHKCTLLALGNGTACRETEMFLTKLIQSGAFSPLNVSYAIVDESGASIYSCSPEAKSEFPALDPNLISAVSIARRLQDPLGELVKVEPKHLGVGMYQHDLPEKQLLHTLNEVVSEAVSFVGVDINTASQCLLKRVAGLNASRASSVIEWRGKFGPFRRREQLLKVKGIGKKTFEQCAGFVRILPETATRGNEEARPEGAAKGGGEELNPLEQTWIHPEWYAIAREFIEHCGCDARKLGTLEFIEKVRPVAEGDRAELAERFGTDSGTVDVIVRALTMRGNEDIRSDRDLPVFRDNMKSLEDLSVDASLSGVVRNVTHFGAFVDIGVGRDGLVPTRWCWNEDLRVGQRVEVEVKEIDWARGRVTLKLLATL